MAPCTPVSPPQAFPFNGSSRRVSAPPPAPLRCPDDKKRRSLLALSETPAKCRRRLSFSEDHPPAEPFELPPAFRQLDHQHHAVRHDAWTQIARLLHDATPHPRLAHAILSPLLAVLHHPDENHFQVVAALLPDLLSSLRASDQPNFTAHHTTLMCAVMDSVSLLNKPSRALENLLTVLRDEQCARIMPRHAANRAHSLLSTALSCLRSPDLDTQLWPLLLHLVALTVDACERADLHSDTFSLSPCDVTTILNSVDIMASRNLTHTIAAMDALKVVFSRKQVLLQFLRSDASAVIVEISSLFADNVSLQHRCVDLLACLSSPTILTVSEL